MTLRYIVDHYKLHTVFIFDYLINKTFTKGGLIAGLWCETAVVLAGFTTVSSKWVYVIVKTVNMTHSQYVYMQSEKVELLVYFLNRTFKIHAVRLDRVFGDSSPLNLYISVKPDWPRRRTNDSKLPHWGLTWNFNSINAKHGRSCIVICLTIGLNDLGE